MASNNDESFLSSSLDSSSDEGHSSGNETDSESENFERDMRQIVNVMRTFNPYMYEPEREVSDTSNESSSEESMEERTSSEEIGVTAAPDIGLRVGNLDWCKCKNCRVETREIDCLCCNEVDALNSKFDAEQPLDCITRSEEFKMLCTNKTVLKNVLVAFHETKGDHLEPTPTNKSLRYAAYKQFIWWVFNYLGSGQRRVIPSCALWLIRSLFPEADENYTKYSEGKKD